MNIRFRLNKILWTWRDSNPRPLQCDLRFYLLNKKRLPIRWQSLSIISFNKADNLIELPSQLAFLDQAHYLPNFFDQLHEWIFQRSCQELFMYHLVGILELILGKNQAEQVTCTILVRKPVRSLHI
jgi:hypothetical protein